MEAGKRSGHIVERLGDRGMHLRVTSRRYTVADAERDGARYLELMRQIRSPVLSISDLSALRELEPGARPVWSHLLADHGDRIAIVHALLPQGTIGKIVGMAASAWGMVVGVHISCYSDREAWAAAVACSGLQPPVRRGVA